MKGAELVSLRIFIHFQSQLVLITYSAVITQVARHCQQINKSVGHQFYQDDSAFYIHVYHHWFVIIIF